MIMVQRVCIVRCETNLLHVMFESLNVCTASCNTTTNSCMKSAIHRKTLEGRDFTIMYFVSPLHVFCDDQSSVTSTDLNRTGSRVKQVPDNKHMVPFEARVTARS